MKRTYFIYGLALLGLLVASILAVNISQSAGIESSLKKLGKGEREYQQARQQILLGASDPSKQLFRFVANKKNNLRARIQGLKIILELTYHQDLSEGGPYVSGLLAEGSPELTGMSLRVYERLQTLQGVKPVVDLFMTAADTALMQQCVRALNAAVIPLEQKLARSVQTGDTLLFDSCRALAEAFPVGKGRLYHAVAHYYDRIGDFDNALEYYRRMGIIKKWWITGEFENHKMAAFIRRLEPELRPFNPADSFVVGPGRKSGWIRLENVPPNGVVDFRSLLVKQQHSVAYAFVYVHAPRACDALLFVGSDDGNRIWVNDSLVWSNEVFRGVIMDSDVIRVRFNAGVNTLLVKVAQEMGGWDLICRLTDIRGEGMPELRMALENTIAPNQMQRIIDAAVRGDTQWRQAARSLGFDDEMSLHQLFSVIGDDAQPEQVRVAACDVLDEINAGRSIPVGEAALIAVAADRADRTAEQALLSRIVGSLLRMQTSRGLDLGLLLRKRDEQALRYLGNGLVSAYCRSRIMAFGNPYERPRAASLQRMFHEIESLNPHDPWVAHRVADSRAWRGDSAAARKRVAAYLMPREWLYRTAPERAIDGRKSVHNDRDFFPDSMTWARAAGDSLTGGWRSIDTREYQAAYGLFVPVNPEYLSSNPRDYCIMYTRVKSDAAESVYVAASVPAPYRIWLNGSLIGTDSTREGVSYYLGRRYPWQPRFFDVTKYRVVIDKGINEIALVVRNSWFIDRHDLFFRLGFYDRGGRPLGCADNTLETGTVGIQ